MSPEDYAARVYGGVLGKTIGVYLGRPFEGWTYDRIQEQLGDITDYVHERRNVPLIVTDDDISGTFTFLRALADHGYSKDISAKQIGDSWLNYLIEERTILWWGGIGNSTEHTAYLRLKHGISAPESGSAALNGKVVSEQIGAQIFIDGWAMVAPGDPDLAVKLAREAASVSHDGEAVNGALVLAAMEALAFVEADTNKLLDQALTYIPGNAVITQLIDDVRNWHAKESDWRTTREWLEEKYGYHIYGGNCHMVPNHGLIVHSLLHGNDDFSETMKIINTCGWDTDCNSGNVGCLMGIKNGIAGIDASVGTGTDWRGPVADRIYVPTADPTWGISDCVRETLAIVNTRHAINDESMWQPKSGAEFHFELPGSVQGFTVTDGEGEITNVSGFSQAGQFSLRLAASAPARFGSPVFAPSKEIAKRFEGAGYALLASPRVHPGQTLKAQLIGDGESVPVRLYAAYYGENDEPALIYSEEVNLGDAETTQVELLVPPEAQPVFEVGVAANGIGVVHLDYLTWDGEPEVVLEQPSHRGTMWRRAWVNGADLFDSWGESYRLVQNEGRGLLIQGSRGWQNYQVSADVTPHLVQAAGICGRCQGMRRYYGLYLHRDGELRLVKVVDSETVLAHIPLNWEFGQTLELALTFSGQHISAAVDGKVVMEVSDDSLGCGAAALLVEEGRTATQRVRISKV